MKKGILLIVAMTLFFFVANAQTVVIDIQESDGGCGVGTDCEANIACFDLLITINQPNWALSSYNVWTQYPVPPTMSYLSDNACISNNGGDTEDNPNGQYRVAGIDGEFVLPVNTPTIFHSICYSYSDEMEIKDSLIASGGTLLLYGTPFYTTVTLINNLTGQTAGLVIPQQEFLTLDGSTFTCLNPELSILKELTSNADNDNSNTISEGDVLTYTLTATNTGSVQETNVVVSDPMLTPSSASCATLDPGETCILVGTYTVTQDDVDAGEIVNTGTVDSDNTDPKEDQVITPVPNTPGIDIEKTLLTDVTGGVSPGDVLSYSVKVENTGDVTLHNVVVSDPKLTPNSTTCPSIAIGGFCTLSGLYIVTQADINAGQIVNTATGNSDETDEVVDQVITPIIQNPEISIEKSLISDISGGIEVGDILVYYIEVTNSGNLTLHNVTISDPMLTPNFKTCSTVAPTGICTLVGTYIVKQSDVDAGQIVNTATGDSDETGPETDEVTTPIAQTPEITTVKSLITDISGGVIAGDVISYEVVVTNTGNITLNNVTVSDVKLTPDQTSCATLAPGDACTLTGTYTISQTDIDAGQIVNEGIGDSDETPPDFDEIITPLPSAPEMTTTKNLLTDISGGVSVGDVLIYQIEALNSGDITLHNVTVTDDKLTPGLANCATLLPGNVCTLTGIYTVTQADKDAGQIVNTGIGDSDETDPEPDEITTPLDQNPAIETVKTLLTDISGGVEVGDVLTYQVEVTNIGDITLNNVSVTDDKLTPDFTSCPSLAIGETCTLIGEYTVTQDDKDAGEIVNTGIGDSDETDPEPDEITSPLDQNPAIETVKTLLTDISGGVEVGDVLTYQIEVTNIGDITLNNVSVTDDKLTPDFTTCASLAIGDVCTLIGEYTVTQADKDAGQIVNTGIGDSDETDPEPDEITTPLDQNPALETAKTLLTDISGGVMAGDVLTFSIVVTNIGDITLTNVTVSDGMISPGFHSCQTLEPLQACTLTGNYTLTQADIQAGQIVNTGIGNSNETPEDSDLLTTPLPQVAEMEIQKQLLTDVSGGISPGDILTYYIEVKNTGNVILNNVEVSDPMLTPNSHSCAMLVPQGICSLTGIYTVVQSDIDAGEIVNTATGDSDETDPLDDQLITPIEQIPDIDIVKTLITDISAGVFTGDELVYTVEVTNTGNITLTNVQVSDTKITPAFTNCTSVPPGEVCTLTGTYTVTQDDIETGQIVNTGTGTSDQAGPVFDELNTPLLQIPELTTTKTLLTDISLGVYVNDVLTYSVEVLNSGNVALTNVTVTDTKITPNSTICGVLYPGEICTLTGNYSVTQDDINAGQIVNTGVGDSDQTGPDPDELTTPVFSGPIITATDDQGLPVNGYDGGLSFANVLVNDLLGVDPVNPAEVTITQISSTNPGVDLNETTGEVTVAQGTPSGTYYVVYEICEIINPTNCDQATVTVPVTAPEIVANDDTGTPVNGYEGGVSVPNVLVNDLLNGDPVDIADVTLEEISSEDPGVTLNPATGEVNVAPGTPAGTYELVYEICEIVNPDNCDQATVTVIVEAPEIIANDDTGTPVNGYEGGVAVPDVLVNDLLNGDPVDIADVTLEEISSEDPGVTLNPVNGEVNVAPGTPAGTYELVYEICEIVNPDNCDQATVTVIVEAPEIIANDDTGTPVNGYEGGVAVPDVLVNDLLNGDPVDIADVTLQEISSEDPGVMLNPATGEVNVAPGTPAGTYELVYEICEIVNPDNCDQATVTVIVEAPEIIANDDTGTPVNGYEGGVSVPNVLVNDFLNGDPVDIADVTLEEISSEDPGVTLNPATGEVNVAPGTPAGTYQLVYEICEIVNPTNCDQATVTVTVLAPEIIANDDIGDPVNGYAGGVSLDNVLENDLLNGVLVDITEVTITQISTTNPGVTLDQLTGEVTVAPGTPAGNYELVYEICEILNPDNCDQATVFVEVLFSTIVANDDTGDPVIGLLGGISLTNVLVNDELNGLPVDIADVIITQNSTSISSVTLDPLTGEVNVGPGTPEGSYEIVYTICEILNPTNCDDAVVTIPVLAAEIVANDDAGDPVNGFEGGVSYVDVLINDLLNGDPVDILDINLTQISSTNPGVTLNPLTGEVVVAPGTPACNYELVYKICEILNPDNCDQATVTVPVTAPEIIANDDSGNPVNGFEGGVSFTNVLINDLLNGDAVDITDITLTQISTSNPGVTLDPLSGEVNVAPGTPAGNYELVYEICEILNPDNCDQATVTVPVTAPEIIANDDAGDPINGYTGGVSFVNVLENDLLNGLPVDPADITLGEISSTNPGVTLNPLTGEVNVAPGTPEGNYELVYEICEVVNPANCDQATVTVPVTAPEIIANDDAGTPLNGVFGGVSFADVLFNDLLNGLQVDISDITLVEISSTNAGVSLNPLTGEVIVSPGTPAGDYELVYEICEVVNPTNCDQATVTVPVFEEPSGEFCFNEEPAETGVLSYFCSTEPIAFTLCDILTGEAPFTICWELDGAPDCETIVYIGDTLFLQTLDPGTYHVEITSITDNLGNFATDLTSCDFNIEVVTGPTAYAGIDATVCEGINHVLSAATASNYSSLEWTGGQGGVFIPSNTMLNPMYIPSALDIENGFVDLCLSANPEDPCTTPFTDCLTLTIRANAVANAGIDISVCETDGFVELNGVVTNGNPAWAETIFTGGFFEDANLASTKYFFSGDDILLGTIELCLTAIPSNPCFIPDTDCLNVTITQSPDVNAGLDKQVCEGESILMDDASADNAASLEWTTNGDGTFSDNSIIDPIYYPGEDDITLGSAQLCLIGYPLGGCADFSINCLNLTILNAPSASIGPDQELACADYDVDNGAWLPLEFNNTITGDYISIEWTTDGDGTFSNPNAENPKYYLGLSDIWDGDLEICINIQAAGNCLFNVTECITIYVPQQLIYFDEDKWWGISSYLETDLPTVPEVMEPLVLIPGSQYLVNMVDKQGKYYWPEPVPPQATLGDWMPIGYKLKVKNTPACLPIYGDSLADQTFEVNGSFTYLPVLTNVPTDIETLFAGHLEDILLIYHWAEGQLWTPIASDFDELYPGYAYLLVNKFGYDPYTVTYPDFVPDAPHLYPIQVKKSDKANNSPWSDVKNTALPHIFLFAENAVSRLLPGDILGVFNEGNECFGMAEYGDKDAIYKLVAMGNNGISKDERGFNVNDKMTFKVYRQSTGEELEVSFIYDTQFPSSDGLYANNGVSMVKDIVISTTSITGPFAESYQLNVYPNPASVDLNIVSNQIISEIQILNNLGQVVFESNPEAKSTVVDVSMHPKGIYLVAVKSENDQVTIKRVSIY